MIDPDLLIGLFVLILLVIYLAVLIFVVRDGTKTSNSLPCPTGACATNIYNGEKTCPATSSDVVQYDPTLEVCNSPNSCDNPLTPFAVNTDGSTNDTGLCAGSTQCRCLSKAMCSNYVLSTFSAISGQPYNAFAGQRIYFTQSSSYTDAAGANQTLPPLQLDNALTDFCAIPASWVERISPVGCLDGVFAYVPEDPNNFDPTNTPLSCVIGTPSTNTLLANVLNPSNGEILYQLLVCPAGSTSIYDAGSQQNYCQ